MLKNLVNKATRSSTGAIQVQSRSSMPLASSVRHHASGDEHKQKSSEPESKPLQAPPSLSRKRSSSSSSSSPSATRTSHKKKPQATNKPLLDADILDELAICLAHNKRQTRFEWLDMFEKYDETQSGLLSPNDFVKCIRKMGMKLDTKQEKMLVQSFEQVASSSSHKSKSKSKRNQDDEDQTKRVVYQDFLLFGLFLKDSARLDDLALEMDHKIATARPRKNTKTNSSNSKSSSHQWIALQELRRLDRKESHFISVDAFERFLKNPSGDDAEKMQLDLDKKEIRLLVERFEFDRVGIDYELFCWWLQPELTLDLKRLHVRLKHWFVQWQQREDEDVEVEDLLSKQSVKGMLSLEKFRQTMAELGLLLNDVQSRALVQEFDEDHENKLHVKSFCREIMASTDSKKSPKGDVSKTSSSEEETHNNKNAEPKRHSSSNSSRSSSEEHPVSHKKTNNKHTNRHDNNHRNTFSWGISKAFRFKNQHTKNPQKSSSEEDTSRSKKSKAKSRTKAHGSSSNEGKSDSEEYDRTRNRLRSTKKNKPVARSSSSEPTPSRHSSKTSKKNKHGDIRSDEESKQENNRKRTKKHVKKSTSSSESRAASQSRSKSRSRSRSPSRSASSSPRAKHQPSRRRSSVKTTRSSRKTKRRDRNESPHRHKKYGSGRRSSSNIKSVTRKRHSSSTESNPEDTRRARSHKHNRSSSMDRVARQHQEGDETSSASGLELAQLRRFKNKQNKHKLKQRRATMDSYSYAYSPQDDEESDQDRGSKSDVEYQKQMKCALRRAFNFFDEDHSDTIDKRELGNVLRAIGDYVSAQELETIMQQADLDHSGQIDFYEFYALVKHRIKQRGFSLSERTENQIRKAFEQLDADQNGFVDEREFEYLIYKTLQVELSIEEQNALLDEIDLNGDGVINIEEFIGFIRMIEKISDLYSSHRHHHHHHHHHDHLDHRRHHLLLGIPRLAFSAMKKIARGAPLDTDANLLAFLGVPSNFRAAITTSFRELKKNSMEYVLSFPPPLTVYSLSQPHTDLRTLRDAESIAELQKVESAQFHAIVSLKTARGVPRPFDVREEDIVSRTVHVCLYQAEPLQPQQPQERAGQQDWTASGIHSPQKGTILGNIHTIPVYWSAKEEDVWQFSRSVTKQDKYKFLVRTNLLNPDLYLLVEFIVKLRTGMFKNKENSDDDNKEHADDQKQHDQKGKSGTASTNTKDNVCARTVDMVCCWCKVPIRLLLAKRSDKLRMQEKLIGGTAISPTDIEQEEILRRRTGWRAIAKAFTKFEFPSVGIKSVPIDWFAEDMRIWVRSMPPTIIAPFASIPIVYEYMKLMCDVLASLGGASSVVACEPVLKLLPKIIEDHEAINVFRRLFDDEMYYPRTDMERQKKFQELVLRMWPSFVNLQAPIPVFALQKGLTAAAASSNAASTSTATATATANPTTASAATPTIGSTAQTTGSTWPIDSRTKLLEFSAKGNLHLADLDACCVPFHVREVGFERIL